MRPALLERVVNRPAQNISLRGLTEIGGELVLLGLQVLAALHGRSELDLALRVQERHAADLPQIHPDRILEADRPEVVVCRLDFEMRRNIGCEIDVLVDVFLYLVSGDSEHRIQLSQPVTERIDPTRIAVAAPNGIQERTHAE